jgi:hypothetical protein
MAIKNLKIFGDRPEPEDGLEADSAHRSSTGGPSTGGKRTGKKRVNPAVSSNRENRKQTRATGLSVTR